MQLFPKSSSPFGKDKHAWLHCTLPQDHVSRQLNHKYKNPLIWTFHWIWKTKSYINKMLFRSWRTYNQHNEVNKRLFSTFLDANIKLGVQRPQRSHSLKDAGCIFQGATLCQGVLHVNLADWGGVGSYTRTHMRRRMKQCAFNGFLPNQQLIQKKIVEVEM